MSEYVRNAKVLAAEMPNHQIPMSSFESISGKWMAMKTKPHVDAKPAANLKGWNL